MGGVGRECVGVCGVCGGWWGVWRVGGECVGVCEWEGWVGSA